MASRLEGQRSWSALRAGLADALELELPAATRLRHELHAAPDLSGSEEPTAARVAAAMEAPGAPAVAGAGRVIRLGPPTGPAVALRAELDALPIHERTGAPFAAGNGAMHACGHDVHLAALTALVRAARRVELPVAMLAILQPSEETNPSGANLLVESRALDAHTIEAFAAVHVQPTVAPGAVTVGSGPVNAASDEFELIVKGRGGHGAYPHRAADPVPVLAQIVLGYQQLVSRGVDPMHPGVVTVGMLEAGSAPNVIPDVARARGTIRSMHPGDRAELRSGVVSVAGRIAAAFGCEAEVHLDPGEPVLVNDPHLAAAVEPELELAGFTLADPPRSCGSDDFSYYRAIAPILMLFLGPEVVLGSSLHSPAFLPPDQTVGQVARALLASYLGIAGLTGERRPA
jgi:amidohydrolase